MSEFDYPGGQLAGHASAQEGVTTINRKLKAQVDEPGSDNSGSGALVAAMAIPAIFLDPEMHIVRYTPPAAALFPLLPSDVGRPLRALSHRLAYPELEEDADRVLQTRVPAKREVRDGAGRSFLAQLLPYRHAEGEIAGAVLVFADITEFRAEREAVLQETQQARQEAEAASRTKDHFLATLSHELRTPLTPILTAAESLLKRKDLPPRVRDGLQMICKNIELETHFINDLLDVTRIARGKFEMVRGPLDVHSLIQAAVDISRPDFAAKEQHLTVELQAEHCRTTGDAARLQQLFWNLLKNAAKFTPNLGRIGVTSRNEGEWIVIEVSDTGRGIDPMALTHIFDPYRQENDSVTREFGGLGLGLAISKATVVAHGGSIVASSKGPGQGALFIVKLPLTGTPDGTGNA